MVDLVDILHIANRRKKIGPVDPTIFDTLYSLSDLIVGPDDQETNKSIFAFFDGVHAFRIGLQDGYKENAEPIDDESTPYKFGHSIGYDTRSALIEALAKNNELEIESYKNLFEKLNGVISTIDVELKYMMRSNWGQYELLVEQIANYSPPNIVLKIRLAELLVQYRPLMEQLMSDKLQEGLVEGLEVSKQHTVERHTILGLVYMFRNEAVRAQQSLNQAREFVLFDDFRNPLRQVAHQAMDATTLFHFAYDKVKLIMGVYSQGKEPSS